jgi:RHS repeat-associated protein
MVMAGISSKAAGKVENKKNKFQAQEFNDDLGVNYYEFKYRNHDPQIGRFIQIDPLADEYVYNSTYAFSENKVTGHIELEGLEAVDIRSLIEKGIRQTSPNASEKDIARVMKSSDEGQVKGGLMAASWLKIAGIGALMFTQPEIGIPLAVSELSGVPVTPSPQAWAGPVAAAIENSGFVSLEQRAQQIQGTLPEITQSKTTTAVGSATTAEGNSLTLVASSEKSLRPVQRAALKSGEVAVSGVGHAEQTIINHANANGMTVTQIAASRPICSNCATAISNSGAQAVSPLKIYSAPAIDGTFLKKSTNLQLKQ